MDTANALEQFFIHQLASLQPPKNDPQPLAVSADQLLDWFDSQLMSRQLDLWSRRSQAQGKTFYSIGSCGHEAMAAVASALRTTDPVFLHYRDAAFQIQRAKQADSQGLEQDPLRDLCLSFCAAANDPISGGRHKVLGSKALNIPPQTSTIASHLPKAVGCAYGIALSRKLEHASPYPADAVVVCSFGDASLNHSTAQGAINTASWIASQGLPLPIIFVCEDNGWGISTPTPPSWIEASCSQRPALHYRHCDGTDLVDSYSAMLQAVEWARVQRQPALLHFRCSRLLGHAGADNELSYQTREQIEANFSRDPLLVSARQLVEQRLASCEQLIERYQQMADRVAQRGDWAARQPHRRGTSAIRSSLIPPATGRQQPQLTQPQRIRLFSQEITAQQQPQPLVRLLNWGLMEAMQRYPQLVMMGEDIGRKGGVYQVTQGLQRRFGSHRVIDSLLDEQSILGLAIGLSHHQLIPIAEIQFLAYLHNAEDQLRGEAATLSFFSSGQYTNPMLVRIPSLGYQKGFGGHFHNDNSLAVLRDIPGLIIACPSNGADAVQMLRECLRLVFEEQRIVVWIEPIALYRTLDLYDQGDQGWSHRFSELQPQSSIALGQSHCHGGGTDLCLLSYGNGYYLCRQAQQRLQQQGIEARVIDLRWLKPLPIDLLLEQISPCQRLLIVDECRRSGSLAEQLYTELSEADPDLNIHRLNADDCFIPLGPGAADPLPSLEQIMKLATQLSG